MKKTKYSVHASGFTLIELMVVVAIVAILASIAFPNYQDSLRKSRRADAQAVLLQSAQWMERFYTENNRYDQNIATSAVVVTVVFASSGLTQAPIEGARKYYNISISPSAQDGFTLNAVPIVADDCGTFTLTQTGAKNVTGGTLTADQCWGG